MWAAGANETVDEAVAHAAKWKFETYRKSLSPQTEYWLRHGYEAYQTLDDLFEALIVSGDFDKYYTHWTKEIPMVASKRWFVWSLIVLPGLLATAQNVLDLGVAYPFIASGLLVILLVVTSRPYAKEDRRFSIAFLAIAGCLLWEIYQVILVMYGGHFAVVLTKLALSLALFLGLVMLFFSRGEHGRTLSLTAGSLFVLSILATQLRSYPIQLIGLTAYDWLLRAVPFLALEVLILRKYGSGAGLFFVAACEPLLLQIYLVPEGIETHVGNSLTTGTQVALLAYGLIPSLFFFTINSILILKISRLAVWRALVLVLSLATVVVMAFLRTNLLAPADAGYIWPKSVMWIDLSLLIWAPMLVAFFLDRNGEAQGFSRLPRGVSLS